MQLTYYGHSCFAVFIQGKHILFDPYISPNELARHIAIDEIPADYIFISHGHFDHITDVVRIATRTGAKVIATWETYNWLNQQGLTNTHPMNPGGKWNFEFGTVRCVTAQHGNSLPDGTYGGIACGFVLSTPDGNFYYGGDTALTMDMQLIPQFTTLDFAVFPIGDDLTMGPEEAIVAAQFVKVKKVVGVHYDTFGFIKIDHDRAKETFAKAGMELELVPIGGQIVL